MLHCVFDPQVLLADREVLQDQVVVVELQNESLLERVQAMAMENSSKQQELEKYMRMVREVCDGSAVMMTILTSAFDIIFVISFRPKSLKNREFKLWVSN